MGIQHKLHTLADMLREQGPYTTLLYTAEKLRGGHRAPSGFRDAMPSAPVPDGPFSHTLSFLIPVYNTRPAYLQALAESLLAQTSPQWEACFSDGGSSDPSTTAALQALLLKDPRFKAVFSKNRLGISENTNRALELAEGSWVAPVDHDDTLSPDAAARVLAAAEDGADFVYSDEDKCSEDGQQVIQTVHKPDFQPDSLRSGNYICHLMAMPAERLRSIGGFRPSCDGSQDHDVALRISEVSSQIQHIPCVLYHWRQVGTSYSHESAVRCADAAVGAVNDQLIRLQIPAIAVQEHLRPRIRWSEDARRPAVSLIYQGTGSAARKRMDRCLAAAGKQPDEVIFTADAAQAAGKASGEILVFLMDGVTPCVSGWLDELTLYASRGDVGCCAGMIMSRRNYCFQNGYQRTADGLYLPRQHGERYTGLSFDQDGLSVRNTDAVGPELFAVRKRVWLAYGGIRLNEGPFAAIPFCSRAAADGLLHVVSIHARARKKS